MVVVQTSKNYYAYTTGELGAVQGTDTWTYGNGEWADLLTKWDEKDITYDAIGNPIVFDDLTMTWQGRQLETLSMGSMSFAYDYNTDGQRISKTFTDSESGDTYTTEYFYNGSILAGERTGNNTIVYMYDNNGDLFGFTYNGTEYYYIKNTQNDVTAIADSQGNILVRYYYNAWGSIIDTVDMSSNGIGDINPIRYRSYYYDADTSLYYLNSRYYLAEMCRFLNVDAVVSGIGDNPLGYNMFAYCFNNPVNMSDEDGNFPKWAKKVVAAVAVVAVVAVVAAITVATAGAGTAAAVIAVGAAKGAAIGLVTGAAIGAGTAAVNYRVSTGSWEGADKAALEGAGDGALSGAITGAVTGAASGATKVAQAAKAWDSGTFKSGYQSMKYHYNKHVVSEGLTKGNNVLKYTQDAVSFANRNSSVFEYTYNYNYGNASWNLTYSTGQGGMFTSAGKILTFWYR